MPENDALQGKRFAKNDEGFFCAHWGYIIVHRCRSCGEICRCRAALKAKEQPDDLDLLIKLTAAGRTPRGKR